MGLDSGAEQQTEGWHKPCRLPAFPLISGSLCYS